MPGLWDLGNDVVDHLRHQHSLHLCHQADLGIFQCELVDSVHRRGHRHCTDHLQFRDVLSDVLRR